MKKKYLLFILLFIFYCHQSITESKDLTEEGEYLISITGLSAREKPNFNSKINLTIPIGSSIFLQKTNYIDTYKNSKNSWYFAPTLDVYIFGGFITKALNEKFTPYILYNEYGDEDCPNKQRKIIFARNEAHEERSFSCQDRSINVSRHGNYYLKKNSIEIKWENSIETVKFILENKTEINNISGFAEKIIWNEKFNGWIEEKYIKLYNFSKCRKMENRCALDCSNACSYYNKNKDCILYNFDYEEFEKHFSYFCNKKFS